MSESLLDLRGVSPPLGFGPAPQRALDEWTALSIDRTLGRFDPVNVSSLATALHTDDSDLDVLCDLRAPGFLQCTRGAYGDRPGFRQRTSGNRTIVAFRGHDLHVELVGEPRPVDEQRAYRHAVAHRRLIEIAGPSFTAEVRDLRHRLGLKTEPAIASLLGLPGDPYEQIEDLACAPAEDLRALLCSDRV